MQLVYPNQSKQAIVRRLLPESSAFESPLKRKDFSFS